MFEQKPHIARYCVIVVIAVDLLSNEHQNKQMLLLRLCILIVTLGKVSGKTLTGLCNSILHTTSEEAILNVYSYHNDVFKLKIFKFN